MHRVCVFAGGHKGKRPVFLEGARALGAAIARRRWGLVYGGARVGTMGALADEVLAAGGEVTGVIPRSLVEREIAHEGLTRQIVVESMHERKATMHSLSHAFVVLPGGFGTLDEACEAITWAQLGLHVKPIVLLDVGGYWSSLVVWMRAAVAEGFVPADLVKSIAVTTDVESALDACRPRA